MGLNACSCLRNFDDLAVETDLNGNGEIFGFNFPNSSHFAFSSTDDSVNLTGAGRMSYLIKVNTYDSGTIKNISFCTLKPGKAVVKIQSVFRGSNFRKKFLKNKYEYGLENNDKGNAFISENIKKAEKNFEEKLDYENGWKKYIYEDINDEELNNSINKEKFSQQKFNNIINKNKNLIATKKEGDLIFLNNQTCLFKGKMDNYKYKNNNNNLTGIGELYYKNGVKYEGIFINGKLNGLGRYIDNNFICYEGLFNNGILEGKGKKIKIKEDDNKKIYIGDLKNYIAEGKGKIKYKNYIYEGDFVNDKKQGKGKLTFTVNGNIYEGEFNNDEINGYGKYTFSNKHIYEGFFVNGIFNGKGKYKWPDGCYFNGEYKNGIREGFGEYKFSNGKIYKGPFHMGKPNGKGIIIFKGKNYDCEFKNGKLLTDFKSSINIRNISY